MKSRPLFAKRVAARWALCHKSAWFSAVHNIWRLDDFYDARVTRSECEGSRFCLTADRFFPLSS
jgi:hypothetical protein